MYPASAKSKSDLLADASGQATLCRQILPPTVMPDQIKIFTNLPATSDPGAELMARKVRVGKVN